MELKTCTALVTGANRGLGRAFAIELLQRGAKVYAGVRDPSQLDVYGVTPVILDITDRDAVANAAHVAGDVTLLVNNAGTAYVGDVLTGDLDLLQRDVQTNYFGTLNMIRAFAPVIEGNGGGAILNVLSMLSWVSWPFIGGYGVSKSAAWAMTNAVRLDLASKNVGVTALHVGSMDTDMTAGYDYPKTNPAEVARIALHGIANGLPEVLADDATRQVLSRLSGGVPALYPDLFRQLRTSDRTAG
jgi:NAD(P)-dependent dehydrogenase (short-subunit alcohol dehydrogenase family)